MANNLIKSGWRQLRKDRALGFINIGGLSIGMTAAVLVLFWVQNEFSFDGFQPDSNREYLVTWLNKSNEVIADFSPLPLTAAAMKSIPAVDRATSYYLFAGASLPEVHLAGQTRTEKRVIYADSNWFHLFQYDFIAGNARDFGIRGGIVLSRTLAETYFGTKDAVGRTIRIDSVDYSVAGVIKDNPVNSSFQHELILPLWARFTSVADLADANRTWTTHAARTFLRLKPGADPAQCASRLAQLTKANGGGQELTVRLVPLKEMHFGVGIASSDIVYGDRKVTVIFGCLGGLLLLIACINYINMATARASLRVREISLKKIMGASRARLFGQLIMEALATGTVALLLTLLLVWLALPAFDRVSEKHFVLSFTSPAIPGVLLGTWALAIAMTGIYPALLISAFDPLRMLQNDRSAKATSAWVRKTLVVVQFTAAIVLILGTIILYAQLNYIRQQNKGYDKAQVFTIQLPSSAWYKHNAPGKRETMMDALKTELQRQPAIQEAAYVSGPMMELPMSMSGIADWDGRDKNFDPLIYPLYIEPDARQLFGLELASGKWFTPGDASDKHNYVLNETAAATFGLHQPYAGQRFVFFGDTGLVIGIVKDFHFRSLHEKVAPVVLINNPLWKNNLYVKASPHAIPGAIREAGGIFHDFYPDQLFSYTFSDEEFGRIYRSDIRTSRLIGIFAALAVSLSCLGLLGLAAFTASQRKKEIATRKVLGATVLHLVELLSGDFLKLVVISLLIAYPIGWWAMNKWLESFAYRTSIEWWMFVSAGGLALVIAFLTVGMQTVKAATANPAHTLRNS